MLDIEVNVALLELCVRELKGSSESELAATRERLVGLVRSGQPEADPPLAGTFGLSVYERRVLSLLAAIALDLDAQRLASILSNGSDPTIAVIRHVVYRDADPLQAERELRAEGVLRRLHLIERTDGSGETHESKHTWAIAPRILRSLAGDTALDPNMRSLATVSVSSAELSHLVVAASTTDALHAATQVRRDSVFLFSGLAASGRRTLGRSLARGLGVGTIEIDASRLSSDPTRQLKLLARECKLLGRAPLIRNIDALVDEHGQTRVDLVGSELVSELDGPVFITCGVNRPAMRWGRPVTVIDVKPPTSAQRAKLWLDKLGQGTPEDGEHLATMYPLAPALIHHAAEAAKARANGRPMQPEDIAHGVRAVLDDRLGDFAKRVEITQTWEDVVLPDEHFEALQYLVARVRQRRTVYEQWGFAAKVGKGLGTSALFSGPPGTGKTMVAALVAKELGLELYQVDMAKVVSKFIGETERNLAALFDAAEAGHAVLLFDECDSLFGKRTEVKSSNDRYANLETNYLLQRLESFTGICLLTSNHDSNIDPAFKRRLSLHLRFELPEVGERAKLWRATLPAAAPVARDIDVDGLARRFVMSGGYIKNAVMRAAFMAAEQGREISGAHLERAAKLEYEGMGKIVAGS